MARTKKRLYQEGGLPSGTTMVRSGTKLKKSKYSLTESEILKRQLDREKTKKTKYSGERIWNVPLKDLWSTTKERVKKKVDITKKKVEESTLKDIAKKTIFRSTLLSKVVKKGLTKAEKLKEKLRLKMEKLKLKEKMRTGFLEPPVEEL